MVAYLFGLTHSNSCIDFARFQAFHRLKATSNGEYIVEIDTVLMLLSGCGSVWDCLSIRSQPCFVHV